MSKPAAISQMTRPLRSIVSSPTAARVIYPARARYEALYQAAKRSKCALEIRKLAGERHDSRRVSLGEAGAGSEKPFPATRTKPHSWATMLRVRLGMTI